MPPRRALSTTRGTGRAGAGRRRPAASGLQPMAMHTSADTSSLLSQATPVVRATRPPKRSKRAHPGLRHARVGGPGSGLRARCRSSRNAPPSKCCDVEDVVPLEEFTFVRFRTDHRMDQCGMITGVISAQDGVKYRVHILGEMVQTVARRDELVPLVGRRWKQQPKSSSGSPTRKRRSSEMEQQQQLIRPWRERLLPVVAAVSAGSMDGEREDSKVLFPF